MARDGYACITCATWPIFRPRAAAMATGAIGPRVMARDTRRPAGRRSARRLGSSVDGQTPWTRSGWERQDAQSRQGGTELVFPGPARGKMQGQATCLAGDTSHQGEEASWQDLRGCHWFAQPDARGPKTPSSGWTRGEARELAVSLSTLDRMIPKGDSDVERVSRLAPGGVQPPVPAPWLRRRRRERVRPRRWRCAAP